MALAQENTTLEQPRIYLIRMMVFTIVIAILVAILLPQITRAFFANPGLNGLIIFALFLGLIYTMRMVWRLFREVNWVNNFKIANPELANPYTPHLLAPMATLLRYHDTDTVLSPLSMRSLLDSLASRLDEARDISRYLIGLLVFLGLLGTFWGLLETITSVGETIQQLDISSAQSSTVFEKLKSGLEAPLAGMGTSFSSSLFGLAGSLVLGFLDLQASQAQNRFYNDLEDWLSSITDIAASDGQSLKNPNELSYELGELDQSMREMNASLLKTLQFQQTKAAQDHDKEDSMDKLADAVAELAHQMREEQLSVRKWMKDQTLHNDVIRQALMEALTAKVSKPKKE